MSLMLSDDVPRILQFVADCRDSFWSSECEIRESKLGGLGVFAKNDIRGGTTLLKLHKSCLFSASNGTIANLLVDDEIDGVLALNIAFIYETTVFRDKSHWVPYLQSIRIHDRRGQLVLPPSYWSDEVKECLKGSTLDTLHDGLRAEAEVKEGFEMAIDLASKWNGEFGLPIPQGYFDVQVEDREDTLLKFRKFVATAYALSSRIFEIDAHHGNALVPIADLFNHHVTAPDVHFSSLYDVCELCGEPGMCKHLVAEAAMGAQESDEQADPAEVHDSSDDEEDTSHEDELVDMTLENDVCKGEEIFNSYGELSNALLLARYGFTVENNPHDVVHLGKEVKWLLRHNRRHAAKYKWWRRRGWDLYSDWYNSTLESGDGLDFEQDVPRKPWLSEIFIDAQGQPSHALTAFLNLLEMTDMQFSQMRANQSYSQLQEMGTVGARAHLQTLIAYNKLSRSRPLHSIPRPAQIMLDSEHAILRLARTRK